jgi:predicted nucleic acid-binding protein
VTRLLLDTSVLIKWFHAEGESELQAARSLRTAHLHGDIDAHVIDLAYYELGNVLIRALKWRPTDVADQLDDLTAVLGSPLLMNPAGLRRAADLAHAHQLSFYDASWAAAALELGISLVSADRQLLSAGLAESASSVATRLRLPLT